MKDKKMSLDLELWVGEPLKSQAHAIFCGKDAKNRNRKLQPQIAVANRTYESIIIEIVRLQKIANRKSQSQIANRWHESLGLVLL